MGAVIAAAWLADHAFGDPARRHPVAGFGLVAGRLEARVWRASRAAGAAYVALLVGGAVAAVAAAERALAGRPWLRRAFGILVLWASLGGRSLERAGLGLRGALDAGDLPAARRLAPALVGRDPASLDAGELARAAVESVAENTSDAVVAPLLWAAALGPAGAAGYRAVNTLDAMVGHRSARYERFGWAAARLDDAASWPAARLSALVAIAAAPLVGGPPREAWRAAWRDGPAHPSPNAGRVEGAFAGALGLRLGGVNRYAHGLETRPALGRGRPPQPRDVTRAVRLARIVGVTCAALSIALARVVRP